jgi:hypothetical protein
MTIQQGERIVIGTPAGAAVATLWQRYRLTTRSHTSAVA